jgi:hypothetical protein
LSPQPYQIWLSGNSTFKSVPYLYSTAGFVVIDSNKVVRYIHNYERGMICLETRLHERMIPIFNERFVSINTECQNKLK